MQIENIPLFHVEFWIQVHNLPAGMMLEKVGTTLANFAGSFVEYDKNNNTSFWRRYMRLRVRIDVRKPLRKNTKVKNKGGDWCTVLFKYERLGMFCFVCGILGHTEAKCEVRFAMAKDDGTRGWSSELRANIRRSGCNSGSKWLKNESANVRKSREGESRSEESVQPTAAAVRSSVTGDGGAGTVEFGSEGEANPILVGVNAFNNNNNNQNSIANSTVGIHDIYGKAIYDNPLFPSKYVHNSQSSPIMEMIPAADTAINSDHKAADIVFKSDHHIQSNYKVGHATNSDNSCCKIQTDQTSQTVDFGTLPNNLSHVVHKLSTHVMHGPHVPSNNIVQKPFAFNAMPAIGTLEHGPPDNNNNASLHATQATIAIVIP